MATGYETITIASSSENTPLEVLRLSSPYLNSVDEALDIWGRPHAEVTGGKMEMGMELGMGMQSSGGLDDFDHDLNFEGNGGLMDGMSTLPFTPAYDLDAFSSTFEDPFSYQSDAFSMLHTNVPESRPSIAGPATSESKEENPDNKLLSFGPPISTCAIFTAAGGQTWPSMTAELYGMFFVAEDVFGDSVPATGRPTELTCYRRNLFQLSGNLTMSRNIKSFVNEQGHQLPLYDLSATLSAVESIEGKATEIISVPWKSSSSTIPGLPMDDKSGTAPPRLPLDLSMNPELDVAVVSIPIAWKRLQFKHATANNGRRKGLQQHYVIQIGLVGTLRTGETVKLAEIQSGPIIVRGRSPRNFDSRKDVSLSAVGDRKIDGKPKALEQTREPSVKVDPGVSNGSYKFYALNALQQPLDLADWTSNTVHPLPSPTIADAHRAKKPSLSHSSSSNTTATRPPIPRTKWKSDNSPTKTTQRSAPIDLSIAEEDQSRSTSSGARSLSLGEGSPRVERVGSTSGGSASNVRRVLVGSPIENADLLYEYFPLSLDDWMPPVDAIYRPHVVHHTIVPPDLKAEQVKNKPKRYFSADD